MKICSIIILTVIVLLPKYASAQGTNSTQTQRRLALVIGNGNYQSSSMLANPENDAKAMKIALQNVGFTVMEYENLNQSQMKKAIDDFGEKLRSNDVGLFFYAGHGIQARGYNYLIPVDAELKSEQQVEYDCVQADRVLALMEASGSKVNILILDACRNNPFERSWTRSESGKGLAFMNAPKGTLIAYATSPGSTASDGSGKNGLYTSAILESIIIPNITILQMFQQVRSIVSQKSNDKQTPWESTSLTGDFSFNSGEIINSEIQGITQENQINGENSDYKKAVIRKDETLRLNSILISGSLSEKAILPGIKYQFCKSFGAYASFKTTLASGDSVNGDKNIIVSLGAAKSISKNINVYLGGGINFAKEEYYGLGEMVENYLTGFFEGGIIVKLNKFAIDMGAGYVLEGRGLGMMGTIGLGYNF